MKTKLGKTYTMNWPNAPKTWNFQLVFRLYACLYLVHNWLYTPPLFRLQIIFSTVLPHFETSLAI